MFLPYVYRVTHIATGQFYIGSRYKNISLKRTAQEDFWVYYFTSSKKVKQLIDEFGKDSFEYEILLESDEGNEYFWAEQDYIKQNISNPLCLNGRYNDRSTGKIKFNTGGVVKGPHSEETKRKISQSNAGKPKKQLRRRKKKTLSDAHKEQIRTRMTGEGNPMFGKPSPKRLDMTPEELLAHKRRIYHETYLRRRAKRLL